MTEGRSAAPGFLLTFEGVEGAGKSTQVVMLETRLLGEGMAPVVTREPGGAPLAEKIRDILLDPVEKGMSPLAELLLILAARAEHVERVVAPALRAGRLVIVDRFSDATIAYQSGGRGLPRELVRALARPAAGGLVPDVTFLLDLPPEAGRRRQRRRAGGPDRLESETADFHARVRSTYLELARGEPDRFAVVDAGDTSERIHEVIYEAFMRAVARAGWRPGGVS